MTTQMTKKCEHIYWNDRKSENYVCEKCGDIKIDRPPLITMETCKKCKHYHCNISNSYVGLYNKEYRKRNKLNTHTGHMISCRHKRTKLPGGFIDIDGKRYRYSPNQHPIVDNIPFNVKGSGGIMFFKSVSVCKCCNHTTDEWKKLWEPQYNEYVTAHPNHKITLEKL